MSKRCYYEILDVDRKATAAQIKSAYRKMALKYHPDKNPSEDAKKMFLQVQQAYDVISDPNERTFYDNNRQKILFNKDQMSKDDLQQYSFGFNIFPYFSAKCYKNFTDQEGAFFQVYRQVFEKIKGEQVKAYKSREDLQEQMRKFQGFGVADTNTQRVLAFYQNWENFTTYKSFVWSQQYDTRDAQNRWVKRRMEEQNKKQRQKQKKNYIKTIKDLVSFVKKRDPRFQKYVIEQKQQEERKQKQKIKKMEQKKKQKQDMKKVKQQLQQERFRQIEEYYKQQNAMLNQGNQKEHNDDDEQQPQFFCAVCDKIFKSQNQLINHEKSKIHKQNLKAIQKQVMLPGQTLQQIQKQQVSETKIAEEEVTKKKRVRRKKNKNNQAKNQQSDQQQEIQQKPKIVQQKKSNNNVKPVDNKGNNKNNKKQQSSDDEVKPQPVKVKQSQKNVKKNSQSQQSDDEDILMSLANNRNNKQTIKPAKVQIDDSDSQDDGRKKRKPKNKKKQQPQIEVKKQQTEKQQGQQQKKLGKAKLKKMKKAEQQQQTGMKCKTCNLTFPSKTKLFDHIKQSGHAATKTG